MMLYTDGVWPGLLDTVGKFFEASKTDHFGRRTFFPYKEYNVCSFAKQLFDGLNIAERAINNSYKRVNGLLYVC